MKFSSRAILVLIASGLVAVYFSEAMAEPRMVIDWVQRYNGPADLLDEARALAIDASGNVYVTGGSTGPGTDLDYATIKYSPGGDTLWVRRYNGPADSADIACALALDTSGNIYVTGRSCGLGTHFDYATVKYSADGHLLWARRYNGPANDNDHALALAVDGSGYAYVTGQSWIGGYDYFTIKYAPSGDTVWVRRYDAGGGSDEARDLAVDASGNVYVTGGYDYAGAHVTVKYAPDGDTLWVRRYNGPDGRGDIARALAVDAHGNAYVAGQTWNPVTYSDYATIKYSPTGDTAWVRHYDGSGSSDWVSDVVVDDSGYVYVAGHSGSLSNYYDYATIKYSPSGGTVWAKRYNARGNSPEYAYDMAVDASGSVYVTGFSDTIGPGVPYGNSDYLTIKYSATGELLWTERYDSPGYIEDRAAALAVDTSGNVYVTGWSFTWGESTDGDFITIKYVPCAIGVSGDVNMDSQITSADIIYFVNYIFKGGAPPSPCEAAGDVDCNGMSTSGDIIYMVNHVFKGEPLPCDVCYSALISECP